MEIRNMVRSDIPQLEELYRQFWDEHSDLSVMGEQFDRISGDERYILLSAVIDGKLVGSVMGIVCEDLYGRCNPFLVLENMVVDKNARRKGIGKSLVSRLEEIAKSKGCSQIILVTELERTDACQFYEACGFQTNNKGYKKKL